MTFIICAWCMFMCWAITGNPGFLVMVVLFLFLDYKERKRIDNGNDED